VYGITSRDFKLWYRPPTRTYDVPKIYNEDRFKKWALSPDSYVYGYVLVRYKNVKSGISLKLKLRWRDWYWKPRINWRYGKHFHWLFFMFWIEYDYTDVPDKVMRDHLEESCVI